MKKEYKKPELLFDSFELSANIALNCVDFLRNPIGFGPNTIFIDRIGCKREPNPNTNEDLDNGYCYHNPNGTVFTS